MNASHAKIILLQSCQDEVIKRTLSVLSTYITSKLICEPKSSYNWSDLEILATIHIG
jgi:hypothetical protein